MASFTTHGTNFSFRVLSLGAGLGEETVRAEITLQNEYVQYKDANVSVSVDELEHWVFSMFRLLAGAYAREYTLPFEGTGIAVDLYPYTENAEAVSRETRRNNDCVMAIRLLLRSQDKKQFLGGVYSLLFHRSEIKEFATALRTELDACFAARTKKKGKYLFVGVSPLGYGGCNYWYLDVTKRVKKGDYVWVSMGRHNTKQIVVVDCVRYFSDDTAPYPPDEVKRVIRIATEKEILEAKGVVL